MSAPVSQDSNEVNEILSKSFGELKTYSKKYSNSSKGIVIISLIVLFFGLSLFFQMCSGVTTGCKPILFLGSSVNNTAQENNTILETDTLNPTVSANLFGFIEVLSLLMITGSLSALVAYYVNESNADALVNSGDVMGSMILNPSEQAFKDKGAADNMLKNQINVLVDKYRSERGNIDDVEMIQLLNSESIKLNTEKQKYTNNERRTSANEFPGNAENFGSTEKSKYV